MAPVASTRGYFQPGLSLVTQLLVVRFHGAGIGFVKMQYAGVLPTSEVAGGAKIPCARWLACKMMRCGVVTTIAAVLRSSKAWRNCAAATRSLMSLQVPMKWRRGGSALGSVGKSSEPIWPRSSTQCQRWSLPPARGTPGATGVPGCTLRSQRVLAVALQRLLYACPVIGVQQLTPRGKAGG